MPYFEGRTLADSSLSPKESVKALAEIANALSYMHDRGIIHNDIGGANIIITAEGAKLIDLGRTQEDLPKQDIFMFSRMILNLLEEENLSDLQDGSLKTLAKQCAKGTMTMKEIEAKLLQMLSSF